MLLKIRMLNKAVLLLCKANIPFGTPFRRSDRVVRSAGHESAAGSSRYEISVEKEQTGPRSAFVGRRRSSCVRACSSGCDIFSVYVCDPEERDKENGRTKAGIAYTRVPDKAIIINTRPRGQTTSNKSRPERTVTAAAAARFFF